VSRSRTARSGIRRTAGIPGGQQRALHLRQRLPALGFTNPYLKHCHEIDIDGDALYLISTGFDRVLRYDITGERFTDGCQLHYERQAHLWNRLLGRLPAGSTAGNLLPPRPTFRRFDPNKPGGPSAGDTCDIKATAPR